MTLARRIGLAGMAGALKVLVAVLVVGVTAMGCGPEREDAAAAATRAWPANWPVPPLPVMWLEHPSGSIWGAPSRYCWHVEDAATPVCEEFAIWSGVDAFPETTAGRPIPVRIESETKPEKVFARVYTRHGDLLVESVQLGPTYPVLDLDLDPGDYHLRVIGQWPYSDASAPLGRRYNEVVYEFGLHVPGAVELIGGCDSTDIGGDLSIVLRSLDDLMRTAKDSANRAGCRFNKPIARLSLTLDNGIRTYTETFRFDPPTLRFGLPLPEDFGSETSGGPLPPGDYSRRIVAISEDGDELDVTTDAEFMPTISLGAG